MTAGYLNLPTRLPRWKTGGSLMSSRVGVRELLWQPARDVHERRNLMKRLIPLFAIASILFAAGYTYSVRPIRHRTTPTAPPPETTSDKTVAAQGLIEPESENITLSSPVSGLVTRLYVKTGDHVHAGQPLFSLDDRELGADLGVKQA